MNSNAVVTLRNKYADDLEEILQCPVCFDLLSGPIPMCTNGHHVCIKCQPQMLHCPFCKMNFNGTRNYLAETLASKFDEIKLSLLDPKYHKNEKVLNNKLCVQTQTDSELFNGQPIGFITNASNLPYNTLIDLKTAPPVGKGKYPCSIRPCTEEFPHGRMLPHIRYFHTDCLILEGSAENGIYNHSWKISYVYPQIFDQAISIHNMGLFFLNVSLSEEGDLNGTVQIVNTTMQAKKFNYSLEIGHLHTSTSYKGLVLTCRKLKTKLFEKGLYVNSTFMKHLIKKKNTEFNCSLTITRLSDLELSLERSGSDSNIRK